MFIYSYCRICRRIIKPLHIKVTCIVYSGHFVKLPQVTTIDRFDELFIGTVRVDSIQQSEDWKESVAINQKSVMFKLDTGAQANIISEKLFRSVSLPNSTLDKTGVKLVTYDGHRINPVGTTVLKCTFKKRNYVL